MSQQLHTPSDNAASFYSRFGKRFLDCVISAVALAILAPLLLVIAVAVKLTSGGPVIFRQQRVGKNGRYFELLKFRSMRVATEPGSQITVAHDDRVTRVGRLLRISKLDELPQLWNVLRGDMSVVGPRPEVPKYVALYTPEQKEVLTVAPGITDPASIAYRHEESLLALQSDPEHFYTNKLMHEKLRMNLAYMRQISFGNDLRTIGRTILKVLKS